MDLPARADEDDDEEEEEVESVTGEEGEQLPKVGTATHVAAQSTDVAKFAQPPAGSSTTTPK